MTLAELYDGFERELRQYAGGLARDAGLADDLVQDTFIRALGHLALLGQLNRYQQRAWLRRTLKNLFLDELRSRRRQEALFNQLAEDTGETVSPGIEAAALGLFEQVPERYQDLLYRRYVLGMTGEQIARELGVPAATVRSRLHMAIQWLRKHRSQLI